MGGSELGRQVVSAHSALVERGPESGEAQVVALES